MTNARPQKKESKDFLLTQEDIVWNKCCDAWEVYLKDAMEDLLKKELPVLKLKPCLCDRKEAKTVKRITSQIWQCPRCGGLGSIIESKDAGELEHQEICSSAAPITEIPCHICGVKKDAVSVPSLDVNKLTLLLSHTETGLKHSLLAEIIEQAYNRGDLLPSKIKK